MHWSALKRIKKINLSLIRYQTTNSLLLSRKYLGTRYFAFVIYDFRFMISLICGLWFGVPVPSVSSVSSPMMKFTYESRT